MEIETRNRSVFDRLGGPKRPQFKNQFNQVCSFWLSGKCNRNYCRFLHPGLPKAKSLSDDYHSNKFKESLKAAVSESGINDGTPNLRALIVEKSSAVVRSKNDYAHTTVPSSLGHVNRERVLSAETSASTAEHKKGRIITLKRSASSEADENPANQKKVLTIERSTKVVQSKKVKVSASSSTLNSEAKSAIEKVLTNERKSEDTVILCTSATNSEVSAKEKYLVNESPCPVAQSKYETVPSSNAATKCEVEGATERVLSGKIPDPVVQSNNVLVSSGNFSTKSEVKSDPANQKKGITTEEPRPPGEGCEKTGKKLCESWVASNCSNGDNCEDLHSWFSGSGFSFLTRLERHQRSVTGITLPSGSDKLFSGDKDGSVCVWDCNSGQCVQTLKLESEIGCMISEGPWVFVGLQNAVKAWNIELNSQHIIPGPNGLVNVMVVAGDILFAGVEDGSIWAWKSSPESSNPVLLPTLKGHTLGVISISVGADRLYSGSKDHTIRVWDLKTLECVQTLEEHKESVTCLAHLDRYLFSGSLDNRLKVWESAEDGNLEVIYEIKQESGVLALCRINDGNNKPILLCSCRDNIVRVYDLPSFAERGRMFSNGEVHTLEIGCRGLLFSGDSTGQLFIWKFD